MTLLHRWRDFGRSMFWLATIGGSLILLHALLLVILKFRKKNSGKQSYGALELPRFEIFLIILAVPCICEASVALIRGKFNFPSSSHMNPYLCIYQAKAKVPKECCFNCFISAKESTKIPILVSFNYFLILEFFDQRISNAVMICKRIS